MKHAEITEGIASKLHLTSPPVALSFVKEAPTGIQVFDGEVPSACSFWRKAEASVFFASAEKHFNCPIGAMTMGFELPDAVKQNLMDVVQTMFGCNYLSRDEPDKIPGVRKEKTGIVYGPLRDFPLAPDLILLWLTPRQAMLYSEAVGTCRWTQATPTAVFGRPACAALPVALQQSECALSLGCTGMRTFTEISEDRLLAVIPGDKAQEFLTALESTVASNETMRSFYEEHKRQFAV